MIKNSLSGANSSNGFVNLLNLMGFEESESVCYSKLIHSIGRVERDELLNIFSVNETLLNFIDLNSLTPERAGIIFEEPK
jgi:hypothetical protein